MIHGTGIEPDIEGAHDSGEWRARRRRDAEERPAAYIRNSARSSRMRSMCSLERAIDALVAVCIFSADRETK